MHEAEPLEQINRTFVRFRGRQLTYFSGCDYFRLASHPRVLAAARDGLRRLSFNVAASRVTTGNHPVYGKLETALAEFFEAEAAVLTPTGYVTAMIAAQALAGSVSHALVDEQAHAALQDAARFLDCPILRFESRNAQSLALQAHRCGPGARILLLTDGMFARDGSAAPLERYLEVLPKDACLLVDDAHGAGILGANGRGTPEHAGVKRQRIIQTITLSKAFGAYGGAILGTAALRRRIISHSHLFIGSTPLPPPLANAGLEAVRLMASHGSQLRADLARNADFVKDGLRQAGVPVPEYPGPILRVVPRNQAEVGQLSRMLLRAGIYPPLTRYLRKSGNGYYRFVISSQHSMLQLQSLLRVLLRFYRERK
ncbi:MAG TPA: pyridoxal phosphate-dependent aminotransferase family protein [Candidatus Paceibacterota bacterium]|mgnify:FL=1|jgi:8-amino-7-oxononanoate synthase|nr:pyridoxal phosphate-dependent aminotransferase family protein [Candidatus Paceibacterota bacterium]